MNHDDPFALEHDMNEAELDAALADTEPLFAGDLAHIVASPADLCTRTAVEVEEELLSQSPANAATGLLSIGWSTARLLFGDQGSEDS